MLHAWCLVSPHVRLASPVSVRRRAQPAPVALTSHAHAAPRRTSGLSAAPPRSNVVAPYLCGLRLASNPTSRRAYLLRRLTRLRRGRSPPMPSCCPRPVLTAASLNQAILALPNPTPGPQPHTGHLLASFPLPL